jgi:hypothetical protein
MGIFKPSIRDRKLECNKTPAAAADDSVQLLPTLG